MRTSFWILVWAILLGSLAKAKSKDYEFLILCQKGYITRDGDSVTASGSNCVIHANKEAAAAASITVYDNMNGP